MSDNPQDKPPVPPAEPPEQGEAAPAAAQPQHPQPQQQPPQPQVLPQDPALMNQAAPAPAAPEQPAEPPQYTAEQLAERKRRGLDKGNIGPKSKGPLPRTSPATATLMAVILGIVYVATSFWTDRNVDFWWTYVKTGMQNGQIDVPLWVSFVLTFILAPIIIFLDLASEAFRLMIDIID